MATIVPGNSSSPMAVVHYFVDNNGVVQQAQSDFPYPVQHSGAYVVVSTAGTTTADPDTGIFFGANVLSAGTASTIQIFDGTQALTPLTTNTVVGAVALGVPSGVGIRCSNLLVVTAGTAVSTTAIYFA